MEREGFGKVQSIIKLLQLAMRPHSAGEEAETEEELMARLGLKLEEELAQLDADRALDSRLARRWASRERARDRDLWRPLRGGGGSGGAAEPADPDAMDAAAGRAVEFEDLEEFVFSLGVNPPPTSCCMPDSLAIRKDPCFCECGCLKNIQSQRVSFQLSICLPCGDRQAAVMDIL